MRKTTSKRKSPKPAKDTNDLGKRAIAVLIDIMVRDGITLDRKTPYRIARLAKRLGWSYRETADFAKKMLAFASTKVLSEEEPAPPEPEKKPDIGQIAHSILQLGQAIFQLIPDTNPNGKDSGLANLLGLVSMFFTQHADKGPVSEVPPAKPRRKKRTKRVRRESPLIGTKTK